MLQVILWVIGILIVLRLLYAALTAFSRKLATKGVEHQIYLECSKMGMTKDNFERIMEFHLDEVEKLSNHMKSYAKTKSYNPIKRTALAVYEVHIRRTHGS